MTDSASAQYKTKPPQPGNGWVNTPNDIRQALRMDVTIRVQGEAPKTAISRVAYGQMQAESAGRDAMLYTTSNNRASLILRTGDKHAGQLLLPMDVRASMLVLRGFGPARVVSSGKSALDFRASDYIYLAKITERSVFQLEVVAMRNGRRVVLPIELHIEDGAKAIRLEY